MRRLAVVLLVLGVLLIVTAPPARADHMTLLPGIPSAKMKLAMQRGYLTVRFDEGTAAYPNFKAQMAQVTSDHFARLGIEYVEVFNETPDVWLTFPTDQQFISMCGAGAAACITYASSPVVIAYRRSLLYTLWTSTHGHEMGHLLGLHEQYDDSGNFACLPISQEAYPTVMNCGTGRWQLQPTDVSLVRGVMVPRPLSSYYGMFYDAGAPWLYYCDADAARGSRVAVMAQAPDGAVYFTGNHLPVGPGCYKLRIVSDPGWSFLLNVENGMSWKVPEQRNDTLVARVP